ncbi:hypothetical protein NITHO_410004 [Nitrolancea hollandica Lb]|uniref:Uncharacterized protein n=1 Tax=Nitrolancea hollandica Lb TaxID=1129897 RepID=I4EJL0_9BACT|nr:hypothetical protein NITHO_410004 [Nitrolancea hollandica Lb]
MFPNFAASSPTGGHFSPRGLDSRATASTIQLLSAPWLIHAASAHCLLTSPNGRAPHNSSPRDGRS